MKRMKAPSRALVTGGAGFIGSHVADCLTRMKYEVVVLDDLSGGFKENVNPQAHFIEGSINDADLVTSVFDKYRFDYVFHLAAYAAEGLSHFIKRFNYENNLIGSINLINASVNHAVKCFVFTSSVAVYGTQKLPMTEDMTPAPEDSYGIAKFAVEQELKISKELFDLNYIIFRPHNVYGERQNIGDKYRNVIGIFMNQIMRGEPLTIFGDGEQTRAFSYIDDVSPIIAKSVLVKAAYNHVFNLGADESYTLNDLAGHVCEAMGVNWPVRHLDERHEVKHAYCSHENVRRVLGWNGQCPLSEGLKRMAAWARRVGSRHSRKFDHIEVAKNMPPSWLD
jgi:UDP-glucose 4-epimerase